MKTENIKGYEGLYEVSENGKIYSLGNGNSTCPKYSEKRELKPRLKNNGYLEIKLFKNGLRKYYSVHRIVALQFINNHSEKKQVNHIDANKKNNNVLNLEWATAKENIKHSFDLGLQVNKKGFENKCSKSIIQFDLNNNFIKIWGSINEVKRELGFNSFGIIGCCKLKVKYKTAYGFKWKYNVN